MNGVVFGSLQKIRLNTIKMCNYLEKYECQEYVIILENYEWHGCVVRFRYVIISKNRDDKNYDFQYEWIIMNSDECNIKPFSVGFPYRIKDKWRIIWISLNNKVK